MTMRRWLARIQAWWFLFFIFAIPFSLYYLTKTPFAISYLNLLSVGFIVLGLINAFVGAVLIKGPKHAGLWWLIAAFLLAMAWALLFTHPLRSGVGLWTSRLTQPLLVGFFGYQLLANRQVKVNQMVAALFWSIVPLILYGAMQRFGVLPYRDPGRVTATYFYPNTFARYVDIILLMALPWILFGPVKSRRWLMGIWLVGVVLLLSAISYNGAATLFVGLFALLWFLPRPFKSLKWTAITVLVIVGVGTLLYAPHLPKYQTSITSSRLSRLEFWQVAAGVIRTDNHFWTGIGIKGWETGYPTLVSKYINYWPPRNWGSVQPQDVFLDSMLKAGLPGLFAITALMLWPIFEGVALARTYVHRNPNWWFGLSMAAYGIGMLFFGLIDDPIWSDDTMPILFIFYFALAFAIHYQLGRHRATHRLESSD